MLNFLQYTATILGIGGAMFVALKQKTGFVIWLIGNGLWILFEIKTNQFGVKMKNNLSTEEPLTIKMRKI